MNIAKENTAEGTKIKNTKMKTFFRDVKQGWQLYVIFLLPFLYLMIFKYYPMYGAIIAFKDFDPIEGIIGSRWVGLEHVMAFINSHEFWRVFKNTLTLGLYQILASFPFPIILALSLNYVASKRFKKATQMITYAPHFISVVVLVGILFMLLDPRGPLNEFLAIFGVDSINFMAKSELFKSIFVWSDVWQNIGFGSIIYLAALAGVDPAQHEAAIIDGATKLQRIWHIDIPSILPTIIILLILNMGGFLDTGFEKALLMQNPLNISSSEIIDTYVYKTGLTSAFPQYSYAAAIGLFKAVIGFILIIGANWSARKVGQSGLW